MQRKRGYLLAILVTLLMGCAAFLPKPRFFMVHLKSGDIQHCEGSTGGIIGITYAKECQKQYEFLGYIRAEDLTPSQRNALRPIKGADVEIDLQQTIRTE